MDLPKNNGITYFGETDYRNKKERFGIKDIDRTRHVYVIGKTGMGKSTLLENMAIQDIQNGHGMAFIDPHGGTAERLLDYVPEERVKDVIYFAPFDTDYPISFNIMEDVGYDKRHLVVSGLMGVFKKIWADAWSARMEYILSNTLFALLEYPDSTLLGVNRMLIDKVYRKKVVDNIKDPSVKSFWVDEFAKYTDRYTQEATPAIQNKIGQFTTNPVIRNIIGQPRTAFDIRKVMDEKKVLIMNLSKGRIGDQNASIIGSMLVTKMYLSAMSRADASGAQMVKLPDFYFFVDEFQSFANESFADILSEARKYKLNLTIAHQYIEQMPEEVRAAVFGNVGTTIAFRVGAFDAEIFEKEFAEKFTQDDMVSLGFAQIYLKLMINGVSSSPFSATTIPPFEPPIESYRDDVIAYTRKTYACPRAEVEEKIITWHTPETPVFVKNRESAPNERQSSEKSYSQNRQAYSNPQTYSNHQIKKETIKTNSRTDTFFKSSQRDKVSLQQGQIGSVESNTRSNFNNNNFSARNTENKEKIISVWRGETRGAAARVPRAAAQKPAYSEKYRNEYRKKESDIPAISLKTLSVKEQNQKNTNEDTKTATMEHLSELRKTLANVMNVNNDRKEITQTFKKEQTNNIGKKYEENHASNSTENDVKNFIDNKLKQETPEQKTKQRDIRTNIKENSKEIPENVLRNVLDKE